MNRQCLICESRAVVTRDAAQGLALLIGLFNSAVKGARQENGLVDVINGLEAVAPAYPGAQQLAEDVVHFHFAGFRYICLRCGALSNEPAPNQESPSAD